MTEHRDQSNVERKSRSWVTLAPQAAFACDDEPDQLVERVIAAETDGDVAFVRMDLRSLGARKWVSSWVRSTAVLCIQPYEAGDD